jgi:hypothetical protein
MFRILPRQEQSLLAMASTMAALLLTVVVFQTPAVAQVATDSLSGEVHDATGAVVPNATVAMKNDASGDLHETKTNSRSAARVLYGHNHRGRVQSLARKGPRV